MSCGGAGGGGGGGGGKFVDGIDGWVQEIRNSSALAMELRLFALTHRYVHGDEYAG